MSKELEAIRDDKLRIGLLALKRLVEANKGKISKDEIMAFDFTFMNITKALLELQAIKEAKHSEALNTIKALEYFIDMKEEKQLDYGDEYIKCLAIENELIFADFMKRNLQRWLELLETDGCDSKNMVATDIQHILEEIEK